MDATKPYSVKTEMLIRKSVPEVFHAFIDPAVTTKFWFTKSSGKLETGKQIEWQWEMYDISVIVDVLSIAENQSIIIAWGNYDTKTQVEWNFIDYQNKYTILKIENSGFKGTTEELITQLCDSMGGFNLVLAGAKAYLEHNIQLNLIKDRFPNGQ